LTASRSTLSAAPLAAFSIAPRAATSIATAARPVTFASLAPLGSLSPSGTDDHRHDRNRGNTTHYLSHQNLLLLGTKKC